MAAVVTRLPDGKNRAQALAESVACAGWLHNRQGKDRTEGGHFVVSDALIVPNVRICDTAVFCKATIL
jgi:hypothetical protein